MLANRFRWCRDSRIPNTAAFAFTVKCVMEASWNNGPGIVTVCVLLLQVCLPKLSQGSGDSSNQWNWRGGGAACFPVSPPLRSTRHCELSSKFSSVMAYKFWAGDVTVSPSNRVQIPATGTDVPQGTSRVSLRLGTQDLNLTFWNFFGVNLSTIA